MSKIATLQVLSLLREANKSHASTRGLVVNSRRLCADAADRELGAKNRLEKRENKICIFCFDGGWQLRNAQHVLKSFA